MIFDVIKMIIHTHLHKHITYLGDPKFNQNKNRVSSNSKNCHVYATLHTNNVKFLRNIHILYLEKIIRLRVVLKHYKSIRKVN